MRVYAYSGDHSMKAWKQACFIAAVGVIGAAIVARIQPWATPLPKPELRRNARGEVNISGAMPDGVIRYTLDGSDPDAKSGPYLAPIALPHGGVVKARVFSRNRKRQGEAAAAQFPPLRGSSRPAQSLVAVTQDRDWPIYDWTQRHEAVTALVRKRRPSLVFIGDSIVHAFGGEPHDRPQPGRAVWKKYYGRRNTANLGFGYDYTENVLWRLTHGELDAAAVKVVVLLIGTNNADRDPAPEIAKAIGAICELIRNKQPQARILLLGILPRSDRPETGLAQITEVNQLIAKYHGQHGVTYLDIGANFISADGSIPKDLMRDHLHPTAKGYEVLATAIEPTLARLLGEAAP